MTELKVQASPCDIELMVQNIEELRTAFVSRLKEAAKDRGLAEWGLGAHLAKVVGKSPKAVSKWFNQESMPDRPAMLALANYLGVRVEWLEHGELPKQSKYMTSVYTLEAIKNLQEEDRAAYSALINSDGVPAALKDGIVPVVGMAQLGMNGYFEAMDFPVGHGDGYVQIFSSDPNAYALKVVGDSMQPRIRSGEFVLIEPNKSYYSGDEVLVRTLDGQSMIKVFMYNRDGEVRLLSVNDAHPPITLREADIEKIHPVGAIIKSTRYIAM